MPTRKTIEANGLTFSYLEAGPTDGPLMLCVHGFPDTAETWFHGVAQAMAEAGYHVVAPNTRGYAPTSIPADGEYGGMAIGQDLVALLQAFDAEDAVVIGHDWGAGALYAALGIDSSRIRAAVAIDIPHLNAIKPTFKLGWAMRHFAKFQFKNHSVKWITKDGGANIDHLYDRWAPAWKRTPEDTAVVRATLSAPEVAEAATAYYRGARADQSGAQAKALVPVLTRPITVPLLAFGGTSGPPITEQDFERARKFCAARYEVVMVDGAGHWVHREKPDVFIEKVLAFLDAESE